MNFTDEEKRVWVNGEGWRDAVSETTLSSEVHIAARQVKILVA